MRKPSFRPHSSTMIRCGRHSPPTGPCLPIWRAQLSNRPASSRERRRIWPATRAVAPPCFRSGSCPSSSPSCRSGSSGNSARDTSAPKSRSSPCSWPASLPSQFSRLTSSPSTACSLRSLQPSLLTVLAAARSQRRSTYILCGVLIGLTAAVRLNGLSIWFLLLVAQVLSGLDSAEGRFSPRQLLASLRAMGGGVWLAALAAAAVLILLQPYLVTAPTLLWQTQSTSDFGYSLRVATGEILRPWSLVDVHTIPYLHYWTHLWPLGVGWPLTLTFLIGVGSALWRPNRGDGAHPALSRHPVRTRRRLAHETRSLSPADAALSLPPGSGSRRRPRVPAALERHRHCDSRNRLRKQQRATASPSQAFISKRTAASQQAAGSLPIFRRAARSVSSAVGSR